MKTNVIHSEFNMQLICVFTIHTFYKIFAKFSLKIAHTERHISKELLDVEIMN